ncbi:helix-turn-helix domain-containing protein [Kitasatospora sp. NPDC058046]|uniref:helix-turn-helix domain-containing protein n=1 Tax=Kitasatospora sp. NPDC058046 TaxID=3346312 RepID=UPI0036DF9CFD
MAEHHHRPRQSGSANRRPTLNSMDRVALRAAMATAYDAVTVRKGKERRGSVRSVADQFDRSYGQTRTLLLEAGVKLRTRGGSAGSH